MNLKAIIASVMVGMVMTAPLARSQPKTPDMKHILQAEYGKYMTAFKKKDVSGIAALATPDMTWKEVDGKTLTRDQALSVLKQSLANINKVDSMSVHIDTLQTRDGVATVTVTQKFAGTILVGKGKPHLVTETSVAKDIWVKSGESWKLKTAEIQKRAMLLDGKPFAPSAGMKPK